MTGQALAKKIWDKAKELKAEGVLSEARFVEEVAKVIDQSKAAPKVSQTKQDLVEELVSSGAYPDIDVAREYDKMLVWACANRQRPTKRRLVAWLNRVEPSLTPERPHQPEIDVFKEPPIGWRKHLLAFAPEYAEHDWAFVAVPFGRRIWQACLKEGLTKNQ